MIEKELLRLRSGEARSGLSVGGLSLLYITAYPCLSPFDQLVLCLLPLKVSIPSFSR